MGIQINGNNDIISALDGSWTAEGASINTSGILTATTFKGNIVGTAATFTGPVTIGGTLTYEDVTNIDSVGIITARNNIHLEDYIYHKGDPDTYIGFSGANTITAKTTGVERLLIDSTGILKLYGDNGNNSVIYGHRAGNLSYILGNQSGTNHFNIKTWQSSSDIIFSLSGNNEKLRITSAGRVGVGTNNPVGNLEVRDAKANLIVAKDGLPVKGNSDLAVSYDMIQLGAGGALASYSATSVTADTMFIHNAYRHSGNDWKRRYADTVARMRVNSPANTWIFETAATGSADSTITSWDESLRITSNRSLLLGGTADVTDLTGDPNGQRGLVIGNTGMGNAGIAIINSTTGAGRIYFGDATGSNAARNRGQIAYYHNDSVDSDYMAFSTAAQERLRITSGGHVIIGGTSWGQAGSMSIASYGGFRSILASGQAQDSLIGAISGVSNGFQVNTTSLNAQTYTFHNGSTVALRITSAGKVGIGQDTPTEIFHIKQNDAVGPSITLENNSDKCWINNWGSTGGGSGRQNKFEINATTVNSLALASAYISLQAGGAGDSYERVRINTTGLLPGTDNNLNLGSSSKRWQNIYTGDLQLSNVSGSTDQNGESITPVGNEVDNTQGTWTIQEGLNDLFLINRIDGKKYKFNLTEVS